MASPVSLAQSFASGGLVSPDIVRASLRQVPGYASNRERAAVVVDVGLRAYDAWVKAKPILFWGGLAGLVASGVMLYARRKRGPEAWAVYAATGVVSAAAAWVARPSGAAAPKPPPGTTDAAGFNLVTALDAARAERAKADPRWADKVWLRTVMLPGIKEEVDKAPIMRAVVGV